MEIAVAVDADRHVDGVVEIMLDAMQNCFKPLTADRLFGWHAALFPTGRSGMYKISVGDWRKPEAGPMQVVSGAMGKEKIHFEAPDSSLVENEMNVFLEWVEKNTTLDLVLKAAIAHLWFVTIHPFDDGNGRIARAITDYILSKNSSNTEFKLYSISTAINKDRKAYYDILDKTTNLFLNKDFDITPWLIWHLNILKNAMQNALLNIEHLIQKTKFWDIHRNQPLNERQIKVLNKIFDVGIDNFEGGLNTKKYISLTKVSKATAVRDITALVEFGCIKQIIGTAGRNVRYEIKF